MLAVVGTLPKAESIDKARPCASLRIPSAGIVKNTVLETLARKVPPPQKTSPQTKIFSEELSADHVAVQSRVGGVEQVSSCTPIPEAFFPEKFARVRANSSPSPRCMYGLSMTTISEEDPAMGYENDTAGDPASAPTFVCFWNGA